MQKHLRCEFAAGCVDRILPPEEIARALSTQSWHQPLPAVAALETQGLTPSEVTALSLRDPVAREPGLDAVQQARERYIEELPHGEEKSTSPNF